MFVLNPEEGSVAYVGFILSISGDTKEWYITAGNSEEEVKHEMEIESGFNAENSFILKVNLPDVSFVKDAYTVKVMEVNCEKGS